MRDDALGFAQGSKRLDFGNRRINWGIKSQIVIHNYPHAVIIADEVHDAFTEKAAHEVVMLLDSFERFDFKHFPKLGIQTYDESEIF